MISLTLLVLTWCYIKVGVDGKRLRTVCSDGTSGKLKAEMGPSDAIRQRSHQRSVISLTPIGVWGSLPPADPNCIEPVDDSSYFCCR